LGNADERAVTREQPRPSRLYDFPFSGNGYKIRLALAQLGITVEYEVVDLIARETKSPKFLAKNPLGEVPVLELNDGTLLLESNAILFWLTDGTPLMPTNPLERARVVQWMLFEQNQIDKVLGRTRFLLRYPGFMPTTEADFDGWYATGYRALAILDDELRGHEFVVGERYSAADICLYGYVHCAEEGGFELSRVPRVVDWLERVRDQPRHVKIGQY
jgi:glutathione S-transferase